jgi:hypothetical protein
MIDEQMSPLAYLKVKPLEVEHMEEIIGVLKSVNWMCSKITMPKEHQLEEMATKTELLLTKLKTDA